MKSRKPRQNQPRRIVVPLEEQSITQSHLKQPSSHTKMSTNGTIHSSVPRPGIDKKHKPKKITKNLSKQQTAQLTPTSSKSRKKPVLTIPLREESLNSSQPQESCRQYCLVEDSFLPITDYKQQKLLDEMFAQTAASTCDINCFSLESKPEVREKPSRLRRKSLSNSLSSLSHQQEKEVVSRHQIGVQTTKREKQMTCAEVETVTQKCQIGMQYSQRKTFSEEVVINEEPKSQVQVQVQVQPVIDEQKNDSLSDLLFKLEFTHLGDEKSFSFLSPSEKEHFVQLLQTVIGKLTPQSHKPQLKPISFQELEDSPSKELDDCTNGPKQNSPRRSPANAELQLLNEKLEQLVCLRQYRQLNLIEDNCEYDNETKVNTTLMSILNFLGHLFCYIEVNYSEEFVYMIRKMYGHSFRQKYKRITRGISFQSEKRFRVIDESLFQDFINQNAQENGSCNYNEVLHLKVIFDAFNQHLEEYRPYYLGNGEQFPWAFKMFITMSEYSIDQDSLQIIFRQAKDKIVEWATLLCGILVETQQKQLHSKNPIELKRLERENKLIANWVTEQNFEKDGIELYGTQKLHETAQSIYLDLIEELIHEADFFFN